MPLILWDDIRLDSVGSPRMRTNSCYGVEEGTFRVSRSRKCNTPDLREVVDVAVEVVTKRFPWFAVARCDLLHLVLLLVGAPPSSTTTTR